MVDYGINGDFDIYFGEYGDFAVVDGRDEFEDDLAIILHDEFGKVVGKGNFSDTIEQQLKLAITRVAREFGIIESISRINVSLLKNEPETIGVELVYDTGDTFEETI
jgi:hypothetical protein